MPGGLILACRLRQAPETGSGAFQPRLNEIEACSHFEYYLMHSINGGVRITPGEDNSTQASEVLCLPEESWSFIVRAPRSSVCVKLTLVRMHIL